MRVTSTTTTPGSLSARSLVRGASPESPPLVPSPPGPTTIRIINRVTGEETQVFETDPCPRHVTGCRSFAKRVWTHGHGHLVHLQLHQLCIKERQLVKFFVRLKDFRVRRSTKGCNSDPAGVPCEKARTRTRLAEAASWRWRLVAMRGPSSKEARLCRFLLRFPDSYHLLPKKL